MLEAYIYDGLRTPFGRHSGALSKVRPDDLLAGVVKEVVARSGFAPETIDDVSVGCVSQAGEDSRNVARHALLLAGLPVETPGAVHNRLCGSGLNALAGAAHAITCGEATVCVAGGVESMTRAPFVVGKAEQAFAKDFKVFDSSLGARFPNPRIESVFGADTMPQTADNVAEEFAIARADQDAFALRSQQRWAAAHAAGRFRDELVPVEIPRKKGESILFDTDEHPRPDTTLEMLAKLKGVNGPELSVTAGNASGVNDGACALLLASEAAAAKHGLTPRARVVAMATAGVLPRIMGFGPAPAVRKVLAKAGLTLDRMDVIELNEAFAAQALAVLRDLGLADDEARVNPNGGAIAIGHPLGMSGARLVTTAAYELQRRNGRYALCTMCIGVGQGIAMIIERV